MTTNIDTLVNSSVSRGRRRPASDVLGSSASAGQLLPAAPYNQQSLTSSTGSLPGLPSLASPTSSLDQQSHAQKSWLEAQEAERDEELGRGAAGAAAKQSAPGVMSPAGLQ
eukprot:7354822-Pyramimonas_sp.AAC.1